MKSAEFLKLKQEAENENTSGDRLAELAHISTELARVVAKNPCATSEVLRSLSWSDDTEICQNVAGNPNTPTAVLWQLGAKFPQALLDNPIFPLLFDPGVRCRVAYNFNTSSSILELLAKDRDLEVRWRVACNSLTPTSSLELLAQDIDPSVRESVASNYHTPASILELLAQDNDARVRSAVAKNSNTPTSSLELLAQDIDPVVHQFAIKNLNQNRTQWMQNFNPHDCY